MNNIYSWEFEDNKERWQYWYLIALSIIIWIVIWGFATGQYGLSFIILLVSGLFYFYENNTDSIIKISLFDLWLKIWENFYEYAKIEKYTFIYIWDTPIYLRIVINKVSLHHIDLKIDKKIMFDLKEILPNYIEEDAKTELSFTERLMLKLKL